MARNKTAIVTGAQQGIGAGLVNGFLKSGYSVVATSLRASKPLRSTPHLVVVNGDIRDRETAAKSVEAAVTHFGTVDVLVNNAGIYITKPFNGRLQYARFGQPLGISPYDATRGEANAETTIGMCDIDLCRARR